MKIEFIAYPYVFTDEGTRYHIKEIKGTPRVGSELDEVLAILSNTANSDCVGGACPIR
jgi:hypothetical protein